MITCPICNEEEQEDKWRVERSDVVWPNRLHLVCPNCGDALSLFQFLTPEFGYEEDTEA